MLRRIVKGMFDTYMQNFAQMSKAMSSVQKEFNDLISYRSRVKSRARKRGQDKSGSPLPRKKHILSKTYEQSDDDSDVDYSDKSDVEQCCFAKSQQGDLGKYVIKKTEQVILNCRPLKIL